MELNEVHAMVEDQDRGRWHPLLHPVTGRDTGIALLVAGPDSRRQADALALMTDELAEAADDMGRVPGVARAEIQRRYLARCILDWKATEDGKPVPFGFGAAMRLLGVAWVKAQADAFAVARAVYFEGAA